MLSSEQILERAAHDGSLDMYVPKNHAKVAQLTSHSAEWPRVLESLLQRLHDVWLPCFNHTPQAVNESARSYTMNFHYPQSHFQLLYRRR